MKFTYFCMILALTSSCSANEKKNKKGNTENNNEKVSDMGRDFSNPTPDASLDSTPKTDIRPSDMEVKVDSSPGNQAPEIFDIMITPTSITEGETFTILLQINDPDGEGDIVDAQLEDRDQNTYGSFVNDGGGQYSKTISWTDINNIRPITFPNGEILTFVAIFEDTAAHSVKTNISGTLNCGGDAACQGSCGMDLCVGACRDLERDPNHCGQCSKFCEQGCTNGSCDVVVGNENYGASCSVNGDCTDSSCVSINSMFFTGDVCAKPCTVDSKCQGDAVCIDLSAIQLGQFCANRCGPQSSCPNGLSCQDVPTANGTDKVCVPF